MASSTSHPSSLAKSALYRQTSKVGAVCGKAARTVLCGARVAIRVPTAIGSCDPELRPLEGDVMFDAPISVYGVLPSGGNPFAQTHRVDTAQLCRRLHR